MYTRTTTTKSSTTNTRGRGRGRGRGRQTNHNSNITRPSVPNEDADDFHPERRMGPPTFARNLASYQPANRGLGNFRGNNNGNVRSNRALSGGSRGRSLSPDVNSDRIPRHAQNPFFVGELMSRFSSMLPSPSFLEDDAAGAQQPEVNSNTNPTYNNIPTLDTLRDTGAPRSNSIYGTNKNSGFYNQNENNNGTKHENKRSEVGRNNNQWKKHEKPTYEDEPQFQPNHPSAHFPGRNRESENVQMNDGYNLPLNMSTNNKSNKYRNSKREHNQDNLKINTSTSSNNSMNPTAIKKMSLEKRVAIMKSCGFLVDSEDQGSYSNQSRTTNSNQPPQNFHRDLIANRTSPRVRYNLEHEPRVIISQPAIAEQNENDNSKSKPENQHPQSSSVTYTERYIRLNSFSPGNIQNYNPLPGKSSDGNVAYSVKEITENKTQSSAISETFFSQLDAMRSSNNGPGNVRYPSDRVSVGKHKNIQKTNEKRPSQKPVNEFNPFLQTEPTSTPQSHPKNKQRRQRHEPDNNFDGLLQLTPYPRRLTQRDVAGGHHFNVQRPARDMNERVPSRAEALDRIQEQYEIKRAEYETKKKEKEAKKREEYLARYKHVDQGFRLNDGLLDEAAGYAPGYNQYETVEDVRQRQQEQLRQDALAYQELQREQQEKQKRMEEKKAREKLEKNKHLDGGYRLGHGDGRGNSRGASNTRLQNKQPKKSSQESKRSNNKDFRNSLSPELLLEGETEAEAIQRQEEQLILEMILQNEMKFQAQNKPETGKENVNEFEGNQAQSLAKSVSNQAQIPSKTASMNPFLSARQTPETPKPESSRTSSLKHLNESGSSSVMPNFPESEYSKVFDKNNEQNDRQVRIIKGNFQVEAPNPPTEHENCRTKRQSRSPQLEQLDSKVSRNSVSQVPSTSQMPSGVEPVPKKPASCILKNQNGAVLVLRPTPEDLNRALGRRLEVQDEADKLGYSTHYKPTPEQAPLYSNNRFERKWELITDKPATGAIPKNTPSSAIKPVSSVATETSNVETKTPKQEEPPFDYKVELRAARLRFQQQYEETLRKKQEQMNES